MFTNNHWFLFCLNDNRDIIILSMYYHIVHFIFTNSWRFHRHMFHISMQTKTCELTFSFLNAQFWRFMKIKIHNIDINCFKILNRNRIYWSNAIPDFFCSNCMIHKRKRLIIQSVFDSPNNGMICCSSNTLYSQSVKMIILFSKCVHNASMESGTNIHN